MEDDEKNIVDVHVGFFGGILLFLVVILVICGLVVATPFIVLYKIIEAILDR